MALDRFALERAREARPAFVDDEAWQARLPVQLETCAIIDAGVDAVAG